LIILKSLIRSDLNDAYMYNIEVSASHDLQVVASRELTSRYPSVTLYFWCELIWGLHIDLSTAIRGIEDTQAHALFVVIIHCISQHYKKQNRKKAT